MTHRDAQKKASAEHKAPAKKAKKKVSGIAVVAGVKKSRTVKAAKTASRKTSTSFAAGMGILNKIDSMEKLLKKAKGTDRKNFIKREINKQHDALDALKTR